MFTVPVEDFVFVVCALVGGGLLLVTVLVDDIIGGILDALHIGFDIGGVSLMPLMLGFVSMFGVGGLYATQVLGVHGGQAAVIGSVAGAGGFGIVFVVFSVLRRSEGSPPFSLDDLVGRTGSVAVAIEPGRLGTVYVKAEGQTHEFTATAPVGLTSGTPVTITSIAANTLIVAGLATPATPVAGSTANSDGGNEGA